MSFTTVLADTTMEEMRALKDGVDSLAALGIVPRIDPAELRLVDMMLPLVQCARETGKLEIEGKENGANLVNNYMTRGVLETTMKNGGLVTLILSLIHI